jgi:hypothetical protein
MGFLVIVCFIPGESTEQPVFDRAGIKISNQFVAPSVAPNDARRSLQKRPVIATF